MLRRQALADEPLATGSSSEKRGLAWSAVGRWPRAEGRRKFRFENKLVSLDSSVIDLCATLFDWAKFRRTKGVIKLHLLLDHEGYLETGPAKVERAL